MESRYSKLVLLGLVVAVVVGAYLYLNRGYGDVSELGYQYATALYSACNQSESRKLEVIYQMAIAARERQELDDRELRWLNGIIEHGRRGDWQAATAEARKLLEDQVTEA
ncbi:MAG: hypothetical protein H6822_34230 [Planctomycetaceae bacterium]|nr:hypothetical protein [Planctomycetales bacterium]MCB9927244.1 hypothetical protein [Planctomycetaceae bacterium]